jgi:NAD(P)-dependent dehydrogenase (short-subunit alcohol dehydrogenase family)
VRKALVTGGASGIGAATVARLGRDGYRVAALDLAPAEDADVSITADVSREEDATRGVDEAVAALGGLDVLVACAGVAGRGTVAETSLEEWERVFAVNVRGVFLAARAAIPHLRAAGGGAIVAVASQLGLVAAADAAAYCASKGAVVQLTRAMAIDHAGEGIRVNCVCPGPTVTPLLDAYFELAGDPAGERRRYAEAQAHGRLVEPEEVADAIAYLASPAATSTIGAALVVDGGYTIR